MFFKLIYINYHLIRHPFSFSLICRLISDSDFDLSHLLKTCPFLNRPKNLEHLSSYEGLKLNRHNSERPYYVLDLKPPNQNHSPSLITNCECGRTMPNDRAPSASRSRRHRTRCQRQRQNEFRSIASREQSISRISRKAPGVPRGVPRLAVNFRHATTRLFLVLHIPSFI